MHATINFPPAPTVGQRIRSFFRPLGNFFVKHPAILSGYIIYGYLFISTMEFYRDFKEKHFDNFLQYFTSFDALLWMWLLAFALVKIIEYRTRALAKQKELAVKEAELQTIHDMLRTLHHEINNPLAVIFLYLSQAERRAKNDPAVLQALAEIRHGAERITSTLREFSNAQGFVTIPTSAGDIMKPKKSHDTA
jgi:signal transduction histidine kinase